MENFWRNSVFDLSRNFYQWHIGNLTVKVIHNFINLVQKLDLYTTLSEKKMHFKETVFIYIYILTTADDGLKPIAHQEPKPVIFGTTLHIWNYKIGSL